MQGTYSLLSYTRIPTNREEANNADIALSMHLALRSHVDGEWTPLNENYGIFFAAAVPLATVPTCARGALSASSRFAGEGDAPASAAVEMQAAMPDVDIALKSLTDPYLFRLKDGRFAIVATRTARGGDPDGSESNSFLLAVSVDLLSYTQLGQVTVAGAHGVHRPAAAYDAAHGCYVVRWQDDDGNAVAATVHDVVAAAGGEPLTPSAQALAWSDIIADYAAQDEEYGIAGCVPGNVISIDKSEAERLTVRFGRVHNTSATVRPARLSASLRGDEARDAVAVLNKTTVTLGYSDGSSTVRRVDWDQAQLAQLGEQAAAGQLRSGQRLRIDGRVRQTVYPVPFAVERADPSVFAWHYNGKPLFLFIATDDTDGNCIDPNGGATHMPLRVAESIAELSDAAGGREREVDVLVRGDLNSEGREMTGCFWAPELHVIAGRLSVLFMPCFDGEAKNPDGTVNERAGKPDMWTGSCHIMQLKQDEDGRDLDPRDKANWSVPEPILGPEGESLNPVQRISLDMTVLQDSGRWYYAWQQIGSVWIARFDPAHPARLIDSPRQIVVPEFAWDNLIAEGPNAIVHEGRIYLIYSGSLVGIDYTTGLISAPAGRRADLTDPGVWTKLDYPLQKSGIYNGEWQLGTGHGMWSHDEDGNLIYVFHNAEYAEGRYGGRDAQVRRVHWASDGMPILDMQADEELDPSYACITMEIVVR